MEVIMIRPADIPALGHLRGVAGVLGCVAEDHLWIKGPPSIDSWSRLPAVGRFVMDPADRLIPLGGQVPVRRLPEGRWLPLAELLLVLPTVAALPGREWAPVSWTLQRSRCVRPAALMTLAARDIARWALTAPQVRWQRLVWAISDEGQACVMGLPLPPVAAQLWTVEKVTNPSGRDVTVALPAGWELPSGVTPTLVVASVQAQSQDTLLIHEDGSIEVIASPGFVPITRATARTFLHA
jgi:hypothetical protein